jgi:hypothetical protein
MRAKHPRKYLILISDILVHGVRELVVSVVSAVVSAAPGQHYQLLRIPHRQMPQNELMDEREDKRYWRRSQKPAKARPRR